MQSVVEYQEWIGIPTLVCSTLSALATGTVIMMWIVARHDEKWSFRYMLILNLTMAGTYHLFTSCQEKTWDRLTGILGTELINSWNNTISGYVVVTSKAWLTDGSACDLNGWIGQISVQAADFSVLSIAVVSFLTLKFNSWVINSSLSQQRLVIGLVWVIPFTTASIALLMNKIEPVSGNWCWIAQRPDYLRYVLGHGWRYLIFLVVIGCYGAIFFNVRRRLTERNHSATLKRSYSFSMYTSSAPDVNVSMANNELIRGNPTMPATVREAVTRASSSERSREIGLEAAQEAKQTAQQRLGIKPRIRVVQSSNLDHDTRHWLFLSLFPLAYILVWIPGIANRLVELTGNSSQSLTMLQASTQLTGFVNALVYGFREHKALQRQKTQARNARVKLHGLDLEA